MMKQWRHLLAISAATMLVVSACGDDDDDDGATEATDAGAAATTAAPADTTPEAATTPAATDGGAGAAEFTVTVTDEGIEGLPDEIPSGVITVTFQNEASGTTTLDFVGVPEDATEDEFRTALSEAAAGGPIDEILQSVSGVTDTGPGETNTSSFEIEAGHHFVAAAPAPEEEEEEPESTAAETTAGADTTAAAGGETTTAGGEEEEQGPPPEAILVHELTVTEEGSGAELPETDGTITAADYSFEVDVQAGETYTFRNDGPDQIHHAVVVGFGSADPAAVEENLIPFLESEGEAPPPEGIDPEQIDFEVGGSNVFSPGLGGTFDAALEPGTYAVLCFIQDRAGGPPHAIANEMFDVFTVT
jgi:hypothetical protein